MSLIVMPTNVKVDFEMMAAADYVAGKIDIEQLEQELEAIIWRGELPARLFGGIAGTTLTTESVER